MPKKMMVSFKLNGYDTDVVVEPRGRHRCAAQVAHRRLQMMGLRRRGRESAQASTAARPSKISPTPGRSDGESARWLQRTTPSGPTMTSARFVIPRGSK